MSARRERKYHMVSHCHDSQSNGSPIPKQAHDDSIPAWMCLRDVDILAKYWYNRSIFTSMTSTLTIYLVDEMKIPISSAKGSWQAILTASVAVSNAGHITSAGSWRMYLWTSGDHEVLVSPCDVRICHPTYLSGRRSDHGLFISKLCTRKELTNEIVIAKRFDDWSVSECYARINISENTEIIAKRVPRLSNRRPGWFMLRTDSSGGSFWKLLANGI